MGAQLEASRSRIVRSEVVIMGSIDKDALANSLVLQNILSYLIKTGVIDEADYIEHTEIIKYAAMQSIENTNGENQEVSKDFIRSVFDEHIAKISN